MNRSNRNLFILLLLIMLTSLAEAKAQKRVDLSVDGRIIDENKITVSNALVTLQTSPCKTCIDHIIQGFKTDAEGIFILEQSLGKNSSVHVFIQEEVPKGYWSAIFPDYLNLSKIPRFKGIRINTSKSSATHLEDVAPTVKYEKVDIDLSRIFSFEDSAIKENISLLKLDIFYGKQKISSNSQVRETAINGHLAKLALPKGVTWRLVFSISSTQGRKQGEVLVSLTKSHKILYKKRDR